ncbi:MAG: TonB-dependent receptor [Gammaproteobacteria bacterium]|nr:TonB-dependent receptor [Gammaproteobacteria bacterium]
MNTSTRRGKYLPLVLATIAANTTLASATAVAQATQPLPSGAELVLEEMVVTARRREEGLQSAPIAVSAFSGDTLAYRGITRLDEIVSFVPSLTLENNPAFGGSSNSAAIYLRGVGQKDFLPTTEPGVGLYVDGVYIARSVGGILDLVDIDRVEVLRGPQGTLFGRNTIGGAINITTLKPEPSEPLSGDVSAALGTDNRINLQGSVMVPISDTFAARASIASFTQDGYVQRADGIDLGDDDTLTGRVSFAWVPNDRLRVDVAADATRDRENGPAMELIGIDYTDLSQLNGLVAAVPPPMAFIHNITTAATGPGMPCAATDAAGNGVTSNPASPNCFDDRYVGADRNTEGTAPTQSNTDIWGASATVAYQLSDSMTLKSISAWRDLDSDFARDGDHSPHRIVHFVDTLEQQQFTQELQLLGSTERLNWILGAYYFAEEGDNVNTLDFTISNFQSGGEFDNEAWAAFAQFTYDITERLHFTLGGRYTDESKKFLPDQVILQNYYAGISSQVPPGNPLADLDAPFLQAGTAILPGVEKEIEIDEFTPLANLSFDVTDDIMLYISYSEGFKSGGFTQRVFPPIVAGFTAPPGTPDIDLIPTYDPEFVEAYELGVKSTLMDGRLRLNAATFYTDYEDIQVQVFNSVAPVTENIGAASITGFELEAQAAPGDGWLLEATFSYLDAEYDSIETELTLIGEDFKFERVPEYAGSLGVSKEFNLPDDSGSLIFRVDWSYRDETYNDAYNTELLKQDAYDLWNASARWTSVDGDWSVLFSGRNLADEEYLVTGVYGTAFQSFEGNYDRGRQWLFEISKSF